MSTSSVEVAGRLTIFALWFNGVPCLQSAFLAGPEAVPSSEKKKSVVVFAGAGASKAVSRERYPTTEEFFEQLPKAVVRNPLLNALSVFLGRTPSSRSTVIDIEMVLWRLDELSSFLQQASDKKNVVGFFLGGEILTIAAGLPKISFERLRDVARRALASAQELRDSINEQVYELYSSLPSHHDLEATCSPLLKKLDDAGLCVELFTTNYDMVLETVLDDFNKRAAIRIETGWAGNVERSLDTSFWIALDRLNEPVGLLTKLHGSVNWVRRDDKILISASMYTGSHDKHAIIYPGFKGQPTDPVFQAFHNHLERCLRRAAGVLFIGFAFRDEYINGLCKRCRGPIVVIDPNDSLELPFTADEVEHLSEGFNEKTALAAAQRLIKAASLERLLA